MAGFPVVISLLVSFIFSVSGAYLRYGNTRLDDSLPNVTMTVGKTESVFCMHFTEPAPAGIMWYDPQDRLVSGSSGDAVYQFIADGGRVATLYFKSYQQRQRGTYECRVDSREKIVRLPVCIGHVGKMGVTNMPPAASVTVSGTMMSDTTKLLSKVTTDPPTQPSSEPPTQSSVIPTATYTVPTPIAMPTPTAAPTPTAQPPNKVEGVHVTPTVRDSSPALEVAWQPVAGPGVTYTVKYSTDPGDLNTPPEGALEEVGVSDTLTILTTLEIATTYYIWVMGVSDGGVGIPSDRRSGVTYSTPGQVSELSYEETTDTSLTLTWTSPKEPNGRLITGFLVEHRQSENESSAASMEIGAEQPMRAVIKGLEPGVPYDISVRPITDAGKGKPVQMTVFSVQQAPTAQVQHVKVERVGSRTAIVSWIPLTLHQARGFPVYFVAYGTTVAGRRRQSQTMNTTDSNVTIDGLDPLQNYWISVDVGTARGLHRGTHGAVITVLPKLEPESDYTSSTDSPATEIGILLGGLVGGALVMLLIVGILVGVSWRKRIRHEKSSNGEEVCVSMDTNPAYEEVHIYDRPVEVCVSMDTNPTYEEVHIYDRPVEVGVSMNTSPACEEVHIYDCPRPVAR